MDNVITRKNLFIHPANIFLRNEFSTCYRNRWNGGGDDAR